MSWFPGWLGCRRPPRPISRERTSGPARRARDRVLAERYLTALPHVAANLEDALVVVYGELLLRSELGQVVDEEVFAGCFAQ